MRRTAGGRIASVGARTSLGVRRSLPPEPLPLQLLDDDLVLRGPSTLRAEDRPVGVAARVRSLPAAVPADGVVHRGHRKSARVSSFFVFMASTFFGFSSPSQP